MFRGGDEKDLISLIRALARFERLKPPAPAAVRRLVRDIGRRIEVLLVEVANRRVAYAIYYFTYSSFLARPTLYLEDIFVLPAHRRQGIGGLIFDRLFRVARQRGCGRMEWAVLDWNRLGHDFYRSRGAKRLANWNLYRLTL